MKTTVLHDLDFDRDGKQRSCLRVPQSRNRAGWGTVEIPITVVKNGRGPTILFTGGVHGDEFEGQIAVSRLARELEPEMVRGRVIMIPAVDLPAALTATRFCPIDNKDMNRCFPGDPAGTFSQKLAYFIDSVLLPLVDVSVDIHTAGSSMDSALSTNMHFLPDPERMRRTLDAAAAFGAPYNVVFWSVDEGATLTSSVERRGILSLGTELGGYARVSVAGVRIAERGLRNVLKHFGVIEGEPDLAQDDGSHGTRHMQVRDASHFIFAPTEGLYEPRHRVGERVEAGESAGFIHFIEDFARPPIELKYPRSGVLWMVQGPGRPRKGDAIVVVMSPYEG